MAGYCLRIRAVSNSSTEGKTVKMIDLEKDDDAFSQLDVTIAIAREIQILMNKHSRTGYVAVRIESYDKFASLSFVSPDGHEIDYELVILRTEGVVC